MLIFVPHKEKSLIWEIIKKTSKKFIFLPVLWLVLLLLMTGCATIEPSQDPLPPEKAEYPLAEPNTPDPITPESKQTDPNDFIPQSPRKNLSEWTRTSKISPLSPCGIQTIRTKSASPHHRSPPTPTPWSRAKHTSRPGGSSIWANFLRLNDE